MPNPPPITILLDPRDDAEVTHTALRAHNPQAGRLTIHPTPATTSTNALADDLLHALDTPVPGPDNARHRRSTQLWDTVAAHITAQHINHVIILRAHLMSQPRWNRLLNLRQDTGIALTLICHGHAMPAAALDALRDQPHHVTTATTPLPAPMPDEPPAHQDEPTAPTRPCCPVCGRIPQLAPVGRPPIYCGPHCRKLAHRVHTTARRTAEAAHLVRHQLTQAHIDLAQAVTELTTATGETGTPTALHPVSAADAATHAANIVRHANQIAQLARDHATIYTEHRNSLTFAASLTANRPPPPPPSTDTACRFTDRSVQILIWGAPMIAGELERGTHFLVWNQSVSRSRWLAVKLAITALASAVTVGLFSLLLTWWAGPLDAIQGGRWGTREFNARDIAPIGYAIFAFALGVALGLLIRRSVPAMAATLAIFLVVQVLVTADLRPDLMPQATTAVRIDQATMGDALRFDRSDAVTGPVRIDLPAPDGAWLLSESPALNSAGRPVPTSEVLTCWSQLLTPGQAKGGTAAGFGPLGACLAPENLHVDIVYQPTDHYWPLQWIETALYCALAALLAAFCFVRIRRLRG